MALSLTSMMTAPLGRWRCMQYVQVKAVVIACVCVCVCVLIDWVVFITVSSSNSMQQLQQGWCDGAKIDTVDDGERGQLSVRRAFRCQAALRMGYSIQVYILVEKRGTAARWWSFGKTVYLRVFTTYRIKNMVSTAINQEDHLSCHNSPQSNGQTLPMSA